MLRCGGSSRPADVIGVYTDAPEELGRIAASQLGVSRRLTTLESGSGALDRLETAFGSDSVVVRTRAELVAAAVLTRPRLSTGEPVDSPLAGDQVELSGPVLAERRQALTVNGSLRRSRATPSASLSDQTVPEQ